MTLERSASGPSNPAALSVYTLDPRDVATAARWDAFVLGQRDATFYHRAGWQQIVEGVLRHRTHFLYAERGGRIEGVLPLAHVRSIFGNALVSLPFAMYGGVAAESEAAASALEARAEHIAVELGVAHLELRHVTARHPDWPAQDLYVTFRREILPDLEANRLAIPRKRRAMIREGMKNGLASEIDATADRFFAVYADNTRRHGTPAQSKRFYDELLRVFGKDADVLTVVDSRGHAVSSVLNFYFRDEVLAYSAGDLDSARHLAANDFKYWELLRRSCERGLKWFDYGRSKRDTGTYLFKKGWGFEPQPLHYEFRLYKRDAIPQLNPTNPKYRVFIEAWRRLPLSVANRLGPMIVRHLG
jgi:FemAB-related protein (PEP-CTERM system-associated)